MMMVRQRVPKFMLRQLQLLDGTATPSARIVRSGGEGEGCILFYWLRVFSPLLFVRKALNFRPPDLGTGLVRA